MNRDFIVSPVRPMVEIFNYIMLTETVTLEGAAVEVDATFVVGSAMMSRDGYHYQMRGRHQRFQSPVPYPGRVALTNRLSVL